MTDGLYAVTLTDEQRAAMRLALEQRRSNLEGVAILARDGSSAVRAAEEKIATVLEILTKLDRALPEGLECGRCGRTVSPQVGTPHYCSERCWSEQIASKAREVAG